MTRNEVRWRCRRSILELDIICQQFFVRHYDQLSDVMQQEFIQLIQEEDPVLMEKIFIKKHYSPLLALIRDQRA